jgi:hypothetical protein
MRYEVKIVGRQTKVMWKIVERERRSISKLWGA